MSNIENIPNTSERPGPFAPAMHGGAEATPPGHLAALPGGQWALWRWVAVRGAGFPASKVFRLSMPRCASDADALHEAEDRVGRARGRALGAVRAMLDDLRSEQAWEETGRRNPLVKAMRELSKGKVPSTTLVPEIREVLEELSAAAAGRDAARAKFDRTYEEAALDTSRELRELVLDERFREAVIWQNRTAFHTAFDSLLGPPAEPVRRNSRRRQHEELAATYLQRYCMKNDTIGFFGPVGWAKLVSGVEGISARPGETLLARRNVHLERWCIDTLAEMFSADKSLRPWAAPRRLPFFHVEGTTLHHPFKGATEIPKEVAAVLLASDGLRTAREVAAEIVRTPSLGFKTEEDVFDVLDYLCGEGLMLWAFECPVGPQAEQHLLDLIARVGDEDLRADAFAVVDELGAGRERVAAAAGDAEKLDESIADLEESFQILTGASSTRAHGQIYAGRTLVYEDCERALDMEIGTDVLQTLGPALSLLLDSARWFTFELARLYREVFARTYADLVKEGGAETVEAVSFWHKVQPHLVAKDLDTFKEVTAALQGRWSEVLSLPEGERRVNYTTEELRARVGEAFAAPRAGWRLGRYQSPDVMIAARSAAAVGRGDYQLVMGELHIGGNTLGNTIFVNQHPAPSELIKAFEADLPEPCIVPIPPRQWPTVTARTVLALVSPKDYALALSYDATCSTPEKVLPLSAFVIEEAGEGLVARTRDGQLSFDIVEFFGAILSLLVAGYFKILPPRKHTPRVTIDRLVVTRESWTFSAGELEFAHLKEEADRFLGLQRWAREHGIPRLVFVKASAEPKPFYVDFASPILVNFFTKTVGQTLREESGEHAITVTEMIPTPEQLWLPDAEGQLYTAELRMVAIDAPPRP
jgi:hypothetical protein